jgi:poly-gamma-glutamate capsule biosynthesis protein CapA/YwtB (metallophosphatase superfamily)
MSTDINLFETAIFETGLVEFSDVGDGLEWTISATGDFRIQPDQLEVLQAGNFPYDETQQLLEADIVLGNLELPVIDDDELVARMKSVVPEKMHGTLKYIPPEILIDAQKMGINFFNLANNHIKDFNADGVIETIKHLDNYAIPWSGAGQDRAEAAAFTIINIDDLNIAIGGYAQNEATAAGIAEPGANVIDPARMLREITALKNDPEIDFVVVSIHDGYEYSSVPRLEMFVLCRMLVDAGADLIIGNHPHVPHGFELYNGKPIFYSLGNFYFNMPSAHAGPFAHWTQRSFVPKLTFRGTKLSKLEIIPIVMDENLFVHRAAGAEREEILELLKYRSDLLNSTDIDLENSDFVKTHVFDVIMKAIYDAGTRNDTEFLDYFLGKQLKKDPYLKCFKDISRLTGRKSSGI